MRISDWSSDVCSSDLAGPIGCSAARSARTATIDGNAVAPLEADRLDGGDLGGERTGARRGERSAAVLGRRLTHPNQRFPSQHVSDERGTVAISFARTLFTEWGYKRLRRVRIGGGALAGEACRQEQRGG